MLNKILKKSKNIISDQADNKLQTQHMDIATYVKFLNANAHFRIFLLKCELHTAKHPEFENPEEFMRELKNLRIIYENVYKNKKIINSTRHKKIKTNIILFTIILIISIMIAESIVLFKKMI